MNSSLTAPCGLDCARCEAYLATQANDALAQAALLAKWKIEYNPNLSTVDLICDGCLAGGRIGGYCGACTVRACAISHAFQTCAECPDYSCVELDKLLIHMPALRAVLDQLRLAH